MNGTQCGSPALRNREFCYFHQESRPARVQVPGEAGKRGSAILVPVFEDANAIQTVVRQVAIMVLEKKIETKAAGLVLYALQIASSNLKRMDQEKPRPVEVVVEPKKVAETPLGMTPWSEKPGGHEPERWKTRWWHGRSGRFWRKRKTRGGRRRIGGCRSSFRRSRKRWKVMARTWRNGLPRMMRQWMD